MSNYILLFSICLITFVVTYTTWVDFNKIQEWRFSKKYEEQEMFSQYYKYVKNYKKKYDYEEFFTRFEHFKETVQELSRLEAIQPGVYGLNKFSDMSATERQNMLSHVGYECQTLHRDRCPPLMHKRGLHENNNKGRGKVHTKDSIPLKFDWRDRGVVSKVLNQHRCHACWAMSIVGVMESMAAIKFGYLYQLSSQELIDCSEHNNGCDYGDVREALNFLCLYDYPVVHEHDYPLKLINENCTMDKNHLPSGMRIEQFSNVCNMNEDLMLRLIAFHGPIVAVVNAKNWPYYNNGVIQRSCDNSWDNMNHVVQIVGYDLTADVPYYIVRNSWGVEFGEDGYLKLAVYGNVCGVANNVAYFDVVYK